MRLIWHFDTANIFTQPPQAAQLSHWGVIFASESFCSAFAAEERTPVKNRHRLLSRSRQRRQFLGADRPSRRTPFGRSLRFERLETRALLTVVVGMDDATGFFTIRDTDGPD